MNYQGAIESEAYVNSPVPKLIIDALLKTLYKSMGMKKQPTKADSAPVPESLESALSGVWDASDGDGKLSKHQQQQLLLLLPHNEAAASASAATLTFLEIIVTILCNLSYVLSNQRHIAYHLDALNLLTNIISQSTDNPKSDGLSSLCEVALTTLSNVSSYLDVNGKTLYEETFLTPPHASMKTAFKQYGLAPYYAARYYDKPSLPPSLILPVCGRHIQCVARIIGVVFASVVSPHSGRGKIVGSLGLLHKLCMMEENR